MARRASVSLVLLLLLAGCSDPAPSDDKAADGGIGAGDDPAVNETVAPRLLPWERVTLYFTADGGLSFERPEAGEVTLASPTTLFLTGPDALQFSLPGSPQAMLFMDETVDVTLYLQSSAPQLSNGGFDLGIWGGTSKGYGLAFFGPTEPFTAPGEVQEVRVSLPFEGRRGFLVPAGETIQFLVAGPMGRETGQPRMLVGGDAASSLEITLANFTVDPFAGVVTTTTEEIEGELTGSTAFFCPPLPGVTPGAHDIVIGPDAAWMHLVIEAESGGYDLDFTLSDGDAVIAVGTTPLGRESVFLGAETLAGLQGKTLGLVVTPCGYGPTTYAGTLVQGINGPAGGA